eukprot:7890433-Pyramimonas_sp.AAC.1
MDGAATPGHPVPPQCSVLHALSRCPIRLELGATCATALFRTLPVLCLRSPLSGRKRQPPMR